MCHYCGGPFVILGVLGTRKHVRCRNCGADFSYELESRRKQPHVKSRMQRGWDLMTEKEN